MNSFPTASTSQFHEAFCVWAYSHTTWLSFGKSCAYLNTEALHLFWISCIYDTVSLLLLVLEVGNFLVFCLYWGLYQWLVLGVGDWHNNQSQMHSSFNWSNLVQGVSSSTLSNQCKLKLDVSCHMWAVSIICLWLEHRDIQGTVYLSVNSIITPRTF